MPSDPRPAEPRPPVTPVAEPPRDAFVRTSESSASAIVPSATLPVEDSPSEPPGEVAPEETLRAILRDATMHALTSVDPRAYFERLARTEPNLFYKYVALLVTKPSTSTGANILNVIGALPRSPLDKLPEGFRVN